MAEGGYLRASAKPCRPPGQVLPVVQNKGMEKNALVSYLTSIFRSPAWDADHFIIYGFVLFSLTLFAWWVIGNLRHSLCSDCLTIGNNGDSGKRVGISTLEVFYLYFQKDLSAESA